MDTVLVGDDTYLLILLCYDAELDVFDRFFQPEPRANSSKRRSWNVKSVKEKLGQEICRHILFIHAISGCLPLKKFVSDTHFREHVKVFDSLPASKEEIVKAGEGLDGLRFRRYCEKVSTGTFQIQPQSLTPTSTAASYHSMRVYHQFIQWKGKEKQVTAEEWGWRLNDDGQ
ncbi:unnamed protein product, partial [Porites evermanni]